MTTTITGAAVPAPATTETTAAGADGRPGTPRVVVLGGGVAGLTAAYELRRRLLDLRLLDGGDTGVLLVSADLIRPLRLAVPLPGRLAHGTKLLLAHYLLW